MNKNLRIILITLVIVLISMISFVGIYQKNLNFYHNRIKEYLLARNLKGSRVVELKVAKTTEETSDENNKQEGEEQQPQENTTGDNEVTQEEQNSITKENLEKTKKVLKKRLKDLGSEDYVIEQNQEDGTTTIYLTENDLADKITEYLPQIGHFAIVDSEDNNNVLMTSSDLKIAKVGYSQTTSGTTVYLSIQFNKEGTKKLEDISNTYVTTTDEEGNETKKEITMKLDNTDVLTTSFEEPIKTGMLSMSIGNVSKNSADLQGYIMQASGMATLLNDGELPIEYSIEKNEYVSLDNVNQMIQIGILILTVILMITFIGMILKYKANGLKICITTIGTIAIFALLIRYTNVYIAMESIVAAIILMIVMTYVNILILRNKKEKGSLESIIQAYKQSWKITIPLLILSVVFSFISWTPIASIGMCILWGCISMVISNFIFTLPMLNDK